VLSTSVDDVVLMALSTSAAVTGFATSMFGAVNNLLGIAEPIPLPETFGTDLDMSDVRTSREFCEKFDRILHTARAMKKASVKLDELIQLDKSRVFDIAGIAHYFEKVIQI
jgi:hypothetical protein